NRGEVWEMGAEAVGATGVACSVHSECSSGSCQDGVCCESACNRFCQSCNMAVPGRCEDIHGGPDPRGVCGTGECAGTCDWSPGFPWCRFDDTRSCGSPDVCTDGFMLAGGRCSRTECQSSSTAPSACLGGLECADSSSCKESCVSRM